jgi:hypothetical protein
MTDITLADITNATTGDDGTGSFDILMQTVQLHLNEQWNLDRLTGSDYATVYLGALQSTMELATKFVLTQEEAGLKADVMAQEILKSVAETDQVQASVSKTYAEIALVDQQQVTELAQTTDATGGQLKFKQDLIAAQTLGFASDTKQKLLKQMFEGYAVTLSIAGTATVPDAATEPAIDALVQEILEDVGSSATVNTAATPDIG